MPKNVFIVNEILNHYWHLILVALFQKSCSLTRLGCNPPLWSVHSDCFPCKTPVLKVYRDLWSVCSPVWVWNEGQWWQTSPISFHVIKGEGDLSWISSGSNQRRDSHSWLDTLRGVWRVSWRPIQHQMRHQHTLMEPVKRRNAYFSTLTAFGQTLTNISALTKCYQNQPNKINLIVSIVLSFSQSFKVLSCLLPSCSVCLSIRPSANYCMLFFIFYLLPWTQICH